MKTLNTLDTLEAIFRGCLQNEISLTEMLVALHNVSAHGTHIGDGGPIDDDMLAQLFDGFELSIEAAKSMEGR